MGRVGNEILDGTTAGKNTRESARLRYLTRVCLGLLGLIALLYITRAGSQIVKVSTFLACMAGLVAIDRLLMPLLDWLKTRESHASQSAKAEKSVGALLDRLPEDWVVLHDVTASYGNIDHLVWRTDGAIFVIETESHRGKVSQERGELRLNGKPFETDLIGQTHANVFWLREFFKGRFGLEPWIHVAIIFPNASIAARQPLRGADIISPSFLYRWLARGCGNPTVAEKLRSQVDRLKSELLAKR